MLLNEAHLISFRNDVSNTNKSNSKKPSLYSGCSNKDNDELNLHRKHTCGLKNVVRKGTNEGEDMFNF